MLFTRSFSRILALFLVFLCFVQVVVSSAPRTITVTLRGKKYELSAATVGDIKKEMEDKAGLSAGQQGVLFKGKMLGNEDKLSDAGVADGDNLLIVPKTGFSRPRPAATMAAPPSMDASEAAAAAAAFPGGEDLMALVNSYTSNPAFQALMGKDLSSLSVEEMMKLKKLTDSFMYKLVRSPVVKAYLDNDDTIEQLRLRLKAMLDQVRENPEVRKNEQLAPILPMLENEQLAGALADTAVLKEQIMGVVNHYMGIADPMPEGEFGDLSLDPSLLTGAKSDDDVDDLDTLPDDHSKEL